MEYLRQFFKSAFSKYVEVVHDDLISFGYEKGLEFHDLRLNTKVINEALQASQSEARLECGRIGRMNLVYTPLPGIVTIQVKDLDIRVRPNFTGLALRKLFETLQELGDLDTPGLAPAPLPPVPAAPLHSCYGPCTPSNCTAGLQGPEIHNTQARLVHPCRIPRAPPIVRRAKFVGAMPAPCPHFQRPVRGGTCESLQGCLQGLALRHQNLNLESLCPDFSVLSNSIASSCGATHARVFEGCEEIKNLLSNCVESVVSLTPPEYDQLDQIKLPSLRLRTSEIWREAIQRRAQQAVTSGEASAASPAVHFAQSSELPQQSVARHASAEAAAAVSKPVAAADPAEGFQPFLTNPMGPCIPLNAPASSSPSKPTHTPFGASFLPPSQQLSFGLPPQTFYQQRAATSYPYTLPRGGSPIAGAWGPPSAAAVTAAAPLRSRQGPASPSSLARSYLQSPAAFATSQHMNCKLSGVNTSGLGFAAANPPSFNARRPPDEKQTFKAHPNT
ncbi:hypothetical protein Esti_001713 [Eimeria stiedai]